jgi:hypothetical protein
VAKVPAAPHRAGRRVRALLLGALLGAILVPAPAANAGLLSGTLLGGSDPLGTVVSSVLDGSVLSGECGARDMQKRFQSWGDAARYFHVPASDAWTIRGDASRAGSAFVLRAGSSVTTPAVCIGIDAPTFRSMGASPNGGVVRVEVISQTGVTLPAGRYRLSTGSAPSPIGLVAVNLLALVGQDFSTDVRIRYVAESGTVRLDELWVDPFRRI